MNDQNGKTGGGVQKGRRSKRVNFGVAAFLAILLVAIVLLVIFIKYSAMEERRQAERQSLCGHPAEFILHESTGATYDDRQVSIIFFEEGVCKNLPPSLCYSDSGFDDTYACIVFPWENVNLFCKALKDNGMTTKKLPPFCP